MKRSNIIALILIASAINLTLMIPGGAIESRNFSHIQPIVLGAFNFFLTALGMISLFIAYFVFKNQKWAFAITILIGLSYFIVYVIDIAKVFPKSPSPMPSSLLGLEILGSILAIPLMYFSLKRYLNYHSDVDNKVNKKAFYLILIIALSIGAGIIIFATNAALSGN